MHPTRRDAIRTGLLGGAAAAVPGAAAARPAPAPAPLGWVEGATPALQLGQAVGVAWPRGAVRRTERFAARDDTGVAVPAQSWVAATWPDGSVKWTGHALPAGRGWRGLIVAPGRPAEPAEPVRVEERADAVVIRVGPLRWDVPRSGPLLLAGATAGGRAVAGPVRMVGSLAASSAPGAAPTPLAAEVERVVVEQSGPVRAVIRLEGRHRAGEGEGATRLMPFTVRLYAYAGSRALRLVHSVVFDGDPATQAVASLGVEAAVPMGSAVPHDRHVRFPTGAAPVVEAARPLTGLRRDPGRAFREAQVAGRATPPVAQMAKAVRDTLERIPVWDAYRLEQASAHGFTLGKRTGNDHAWVPVTQGQRAPGLAYAGSPAGGVALAQRWFWQRHPSALHVDGLSASTARVTAWLWSPAAPPMDLRSYRGVDGMEGYDAQNEGLAVTYEDYEPGWDDARGIARTSELTLWALDATPPTAELEAMAAAAALPPQLAAAPSHLHAAGVFGDWGLPDRSTPNRASVEDQMVRLVDFYADEVDRRSWYGFWDHGDVMHSYDADRHQWKYDIGGFAWANSELSPDLWLWYQAMRSGGGRAWRLAEAMTRHTGEVDSYHAGRFRGLGTRHGIQHWSDSSKQPRVANALYRRHFFYLTTDERTGDLLREFLDSEEALTRVEIGRKVPSRDRTRAAPPGTIDMGFGPSWTALAGAWLTEWERTGDRKWRDRIVAGMDSIGRMARGWLTGSAFFDRASGRFLDPGPVIRLSHLSAVFGAAEVNSELIALVDVPRYAAAWAEYCRWYNAPVEEFTAKFGTRGGGRNLREGHSRLTAWAAARENDAALARRAAAEFLEGGAGLGTWTTDPRRTVNGVTEWPGVSTNGASQWGLAAIQCLALVPEALDAVVIPPWTERNKAQEVS